MLSVLDGTLELDSLKIATQRDFEQGLVAYLMRDFSQAVSRFASVIRADREDKAAIRYYLLAKSTLETPPPPNWDGAMSVGG